MISDFDSINQFDVLPQKVVIRNPVSEEGILSVINLSFHEILFSIFSNGRSYIFNVFFIISDLKYAANLVKAPMAKCNWASTKKRVNRLV